MFSQVVTSVATVRWTSWVKKAWLTPKLQLKMRHPMIV